MRLNYIVKFKIRVFCEHSKDRKAKLDKLYIFTIFSARFCRNKHFWPEIW